MAALDIAGVIGTWVAAFIAIVALVGIIGPILIWRASRTERHKALAAAANTDNEFITKGIHAGPNIWLLQRVKAPLLKTATVLIDSTFVLDPNAFKEVTVGTTWVSLGHLIKAYGVTYSRGDSLEILRDRAYLPVHKIWLLAIGLIGRYGERKDRGKFRSTKRVVRLSTPSASHRVGRTGLIKDGLFIPDRAQKIHGVTGSFEAIYTPGDGFPRFASASKEDLHQQLPDVLAPKTLFKMASGLMPLWDGRFFSLVESSFDNDSLDQFSSDSDANGLADMRAHRRNNRGVYISRPSKKRAPEYFRPHGPTNRRENLLHDGPRAHQLLPASDRDSGMTAMARCFAADQDEVLVLDPARDSHSLSVMLKEHNGRTYVPAESPWIRLPEIRVDDQYSDAQEIVHVSRAGEMAYYHAPVYVNRADTQEMAYSLLEMEWHPENYSIESSKFSVGMRLLGWAGRSLSRVGDRIVDIISNIGLGALEQSKLAQSLEPALRRLEKPFEALCQHNEKVIIDRMIGILMMTNEEFQELFYQSLRHLKQATLSTIQIDVRAATISIPSAFGVLQTFTLDLDRMYPSHIRNQESMTAPYSAIVLASLKACVRSKMLDYRFDAAPLMNFIEACPDVVLVQ